jgi:hypothetical protein
MLWTGQMSNHSSRMGQKVSLSSEVHGQTERSTQPPIQWAFLPEEERSVREVVHSPRSYAEVKNEWNCNSLTHVLL